MAAAVPPLVVQKAINAETDVRFWAQTGYKVGQKLDIGNPSDAAMAPVWDAIHGLVLGEYLTHGFITPTHASPDVQAHLANAANAQQQASAHADAAAHAFAAGDQATAHQHAAAADQAHQVAAASAHAAAAAQPLSIVSAGSRAGARRLADSSSPASPGLPSVAQAAKAASSHAHARAHVVKAPPPTRQQAGSLAVPKRPHEWTDAEKRILAQSIDDAINAERAPLVAAHVEQQSRAQKQVAGPVPTVRPTRDGAGPDATAPAVDDQGRVKQPDASKPWIALAVVGGCLGALAAAAQLNKGRASRPAKRPRRSRAA